VRTIKQSVLRGVDCAFTFYSYNPPKSAQSWVNGEALKVTPGRLVHSSSYLDVPPAWLGEAFLHEAEVLRTTNERAYRNEYLGEVTGTGGNVFENVVVRNIADEELRTLSYFYQGIDWGWYPDPFQWVRVGYDAKSRRLYIFDEVRLHRANNHVSFAAVKDRLRHDEPLTADSAENKSIADFKELGASWIRAASKGPGSVDYSMKWLGGLAEIVIDGRKCPHTAKEFLQYEFERNKDGEYVSGYVDADNHSIDAVRYAMTPVWKLRGA
jgi:phage terminase large subunit